MQKMQIDRIIIFMKLADDGSVIEPCPVCLGLFDGAKGDKK